MLDTYTEKDLLLNKVIETHFKDDDEVQNYLNNPFLCIVEKKYLIQYEVCIRKGNKTLSIWLKYNDFILNEFIPSLYNEIPWITQESINTHNFLHATKKDKVSIVTINLDNFNKLFRSYTVTDNDGAQGYDIEMNGKISKRKNYMINNRNEIVTMHSNGKITSALKKHTDYGYKLIRDDGQEYLLYPNTISLDGIYNINK